MQRSKLEPPKRETEPLKVAPLPGTAMTLPAKPIEPVSMVVEGGVAITELRNDSCRWPVGEPGGDELMRYCAAEVAMATRNAGLYYCQTHIQIAYQPKRGRRV